jgi:hypothetical protein
MIAAKYMNPAFKGMYVMSVLHTWSTRSMLTPGRSFFFEPLQLHLQPPNLLVQLGLPGLGVARVRLGSVGEDRLGSLMELLLPAVDEGGVDGKLAGQLVNGPVTVESSQGHLGLERCRVVLPLTCHHAPLSWTTSTSLAGGPVFGVHYTCRVIPGDLTDAGSLAAIPLDEVTHVLHLAPNTSFVKSVLAALKKAVGKKD